jgi:hypothetical protein
MAVVGDGVALVAIVIERHERAGDGSVDLREPSLGHRGEDTSAGGVAVPQLGGQVAVAGSMVVVSPVGFGAQGAEAIIDGAGIPSQSSRRQQMIGAIAPRYA